MPVKVVTDSVADLPPQVVDELGITVIPLNVRFGEKVYRDGIDLTTEQFYQELTRSKIFPVTSVPSPVTFADAYDKLAEETDEILVITLTSKLSATHEVAVQSIGLMKRPCRVEVIDSERAVMAQGFLVMAAARAAQAGAKLDELIAMVRSNIPRVDMRAAFDTLEYLRRGGRIGAAQALLGAALRIHPLITMKNGLVEPAGRARSRAKAMDHLYQFAADYKRIEEMAVEEAACPGDADLLTDRLGNLFPRERIYRTKTTPVIGAHTGPGLLLVALMGDK
ncbi:MAG: DegV family protein [Anaerolineales bacterium]|nr:DegV family protein [Anaerolineales bacterium]